MQGKWQDLHLGEKSSRDGEHSTERLTHSREMLWFYSGHEQPQRTDHKVWAQENKVEGTACTEHFFVM